MTRTLRWTRTAFSLLLVSLLVVGSLFSAGALALDVARPAMKVTNSGYYPESARGMGYTGQGVTIAIVDTGVDDDHPSLEGAFVGGVDFSLGLGTEGNPGDEDGHGTHVAGIALGRGGGPQDPDRNYAGIAPGASLVDVKVFNVFGVTIGDPLMDGIQWCIDHRKDNWSDDDPLNDGIDIISISVNNDNDSAGQSDISLLINQAVEAGIVVVVSAGNNGPDNSGFGDIAAADAAITVGALDDIGSVKRDDDVVAPYSNRGPRQDDGDDDPLDELKPDIVAPGENITSAEGTLIFSPENYVELSGTSMAAPMVAGTVALMLEANPDLNPEQVKHVLRETAEHRGDPYNTTLHPHYNSSFGFGLLDASRAVKAALNPLDLAVSQTRATPKIPSEGDRITISCTVTNNGELRSSDSFLIFQYQATPFLETKFLSVDLAPGESKPYSYEWLPPGKAGLVTYTVKATDLSFNDTNPEDNLQTVFPVVKSRPEFRVETFELSEEKLETGAIFFAYVQVRNDGETQSDCIVTIFYQDTLGDTEMDRKIISVPAMGFTKTSFQLSAPDEAAESLEVTVVLESLYKLPELITTDNEAARPLVVEEPGDLDENDDTLIFAGVCGVLVIGFLGALVFMGSASTNSSDNASNEDKAEDKGDEDWEKEDEEYDDETDYEEKDRKGKIPLPPARQKKKGHDPDKLFKDFVKVVEHLRSSMNYEAKFGLEKGEFLGLYLKSTHSNTTDLEKEKFVSLVDERLGEFLDPLEMLKALTSTEQKVYRSAVKYYAGETDEEEDNGPGEQETTKGSKPVEPLSKFVLAERKREKLDFTDEEFSKFFSAVDSLLGKLDDTGRQHFKENERGMELYAMASTRHQDMSWEERNEFLELFSQLYAELKDEDKRSFKASEGHYLLKKFFLACEDHITEAKKT